MKRTIMKKKKNSRGSESKDENVTDVDTMDDAFPAIIIIIIIFFFFKKNGQIERQQMSFMRKKNRTQRGGSEKRNRI